MLVSSHLKGTLACGKKHECFMASDKFLFGWASVPTTRGSSLALMWDVIAKGSSSSEHIYSMYSVPVKRRCLIYYVHRFIAACYGVRDHNTALPTLLDTQLLPKNIQDTSDHFALHPFAIHI